MREAFVGKAGSEDRWRNVWLFFQRWRGFVTDEMMRRLAWPLDSYNDRGMIEIGSSVKVFEIFCKMRARPARFDMMHRKFQPRTKDKNVDRVRKIWT